jgi:hypothetical protein
VHAVLAGLAFMASSAAVPSGGVPAGPERAAEGAVVVVASSPTQIGTGAGTIVSIDGDSVRVLTAEHVATFGTLTIRFANDASAPAQIRARLPGHDLAIIEAIVDPARAADLHAATVGSARPGEPVHVWGSGLDGPAFEPARVAAIGGDLPDGPARGRYEVACGLCHRGDSGAGVFDAHGTLVGVYVGYFTFDSGERVGVAETPESAWKIARSKTAITPATAIGSTDPRAATVERNVASTSASNALATAASGSGATEPAARSALR